MGMMVEPNYTVNYDYDNGLGTTLTPWQNLANWADDVNLGTRIGGGVQALGGGAVAIGSFTAAGATAPTVVGAIGFSIAGGMALDQAWAGLQTVWTGVETPTYLNQSLRQAGLSDTQADIAELVIGVAASGGASVAGKVGQTAKIANASKVEALEIVAENGTKVTGFTKHGVDRVIGDTAKRAGVTPEALLNALKNPKNIREGVDNLGRPYQAFIGENARVVVNPKTGKIISVNPLSGKGAN
jgi:hypothetical protein